MAGWVVWSQGGRTFTLKDKEPVDAQGNPITLGEQPIFQAHPMEMENEETAAWQNYFLTRLGGKQLYLQMWEPVYRAEEISPDRYKGIDIPLKRFMDRKADGIFIHMTIAMPGWAWALRTARRSGRQRA